MPLDRTEKRLKYWSIFLSRCKGKTHLFDDRKPVRNHRLGPKIKNFHFQCDISDKKIEAQACIERDVAVFDAAFVDRHKIEKKFEDLWKEDRKDKFSGRWIWDRCKERPRRSLISIAFDGRGLTSPEKEWDSMCDDLRDAIVRLKEVLEPYNK